LKSAAADAYESLQTAGFTSGKIGSLTSLNASDVRKLKADGDKVGWSPPSQRVCEAIDGFCMEHLQANFDLASLRRELDLAVQELNTAKAADRRRERSDGLAESTTAAWATPFTDYLRELSAVLSQTARWLPHVRFDEGFEARSVRVESEPPPKTSAGEAYSNAHRGSVAWHQAVKGSAITVVLADAGHGKTWQLKHHTLGLSRNALKAVQVGAPLDSAPVPFWIHAGDLAECWNAAGRPADRIVNAGLRVLERHGSHVDTGFRQYLADRLTKPAGAAHIIVDAFDELFDDGLRNQAAQALRWLSGLAHEHTDVHLVLSSRPAGYADPFEHRRPGGEALVVLEPDRAEPRYVYPGILSETQVRRIWDRWFEARGQRVPLERLEPALAPTSPLHRFARVPLIAAFCAWVAEDEQVATTRAGLYGQVVRRFMAQSWKSADPGAAGALRQDGSRRAGLEACLMELAWQMAAGGRSWRDALPVDACEEILASPRLAATPGQSLVWELVRQVGILTQPGCGPDEPMGDGPVMWIHRSVHEFLVAKRLLRESAETIATLLEKRCWFHPAWGNVLDFALGMEMSDSTQAELATDVSLMVTDGRDGLGWFASVIVGAELTGRARTAAFRETHNRVWRLHRTGLIAATELAKVLAFSSDTDLDAIVAVLRERLDANGPGQDLWSAFAWAGEPGRAFLAHVIRSAENTEGATAALYRVNARSAITAMESRIRLGLACRAHDAAVLSEVDDGTFELLHERYLSDPASETAAETLGYTRTERAGSALTKPELLEHERADIRLAAAKGLLAFHGNDIDEAGFALLSRMARSDPDRAVRMQVGSSLQTLGLFVPWVESELGEIVSELHHDPIEPELDSLEAIASRLQSIGPGTQLAVTMLLVEPRLLQGPVQEAMFELATRALREDIGFELTRDVALVCGVDEFTELAIDRLRNCEDLYDMTSLAVGLSWAAPENPTVFESLVAYLAKNPNEVLMAALKAYELPAAERIEILVEAMLRLAASAPRAVEAWSEVLRTLLAETPEPDRAILRSQCAEATEHVLKLASED
jgi:hypothetical protein